MSRYARNSSSMKQAANHINPPSTHIRLQGVPELNAAGRGADDVGRLIDAVAQVVDPQEDEQLAGLGVLGRLRHGHTLPRVLLNQHIQPGKGGPGACRRRQVSTF